MIRPQRWRQAVLATAGLLMLQASQTSLAQSRAEPRPNVIIIMSDDQGYRDVGFNGSRDIPTPNIDRIANEGVRFTRGYVTAPVCGPSRAGFLTGRYGARFGYDRNPNGDPTDPRGGIPIAEENMAEMLRRGGYATKAIGKWHMGTHPTLRPLARGFDEFYGFLEGGHDYMPENIEFEDISDSRKPGDWYRAKLVDNGKRVTFDQYLTDELSDRAVEYIGRKAQADRPFFLYLAYNAPHTPFQATDKYLSRFPGIKDPQRRTYAAMISAMDDGIGRVLAELDKRGLAENTLVVFLSDNGGPLTRLTGDGSPVADNGNLRGGKSDLTEGGVRVPFALRWPAKVTGKRDYNRPISSMDIFATLAGETGIKPRNSLDGVNLVPYLSGSRQGDPHDVLFWRKLGQKQYVAMAGDMKLITSPKDKQLYDLSTDVGETRDLAEDRAATVNELSSVTVKWNSQMAPKAAFPPLGTWPPKGYVKPTPATDSGSEAQDQ